MLEGWGVRPWNWEFSTGIQQEIIPRLSASVGYFRRIYGNFNVQDNEALSRADFTEFSVVVPTDARLALSGQTINGIYDQNRVVVEPQHHQAGIRLRQAALALERRGLLDRHAAAEWRAAAGRSEHRQDDERHL